MQRQTCLVSMLPDGSRVSVIDRVGTLLANKVSAPVARTLVREGLAVIKGTSRIQALWGHKGLRTYVLHRDRFTCYYCGRSGATLEHLKPQSRGGKSTPANCVCACEPCNNLKNNRTVAEFLTYIDSFPCECHIDGNFVKRLCFKHRIHAWMSSPDHPSRLRLDAVGVRS